VTFRARLARSVDGYDDVVVKVAPPGLAPTRNRDVLRQARIIRHLDEHHVTPVPHILATDVGEPLEVPPLFVMGFIDGEAWEPHNGATTHASSQLLARRSRIAMDALAALHTSKPPAGEHAGGGGLLGEVERWTRTLSTVDTVDAAAAAWSRELLVDAVPEPLSPVLLHGDYRLGNLMFVEDRLVAMIDWEIWSVGDPRTDLAWFLLHNDTNHPGYEPAESMELPTSAELVAQYTAASGRELPAMEWFAALVRYKQAATAALIHKHNRKAENPTERLEALGAWVPVLLAQAAACLTDVRHAI
jgi:aminoglycoside phosphotransferase (APT) family kinase protein